VEISSARLGAPSKLHAALDEFYAPFGPTGLEFVAAAGEPFYHFAFLVPGDRFDAAFDWAYAR
jgi:hypothetical protein